MKLLTYIHFSHEIVNVHSL